MYVLLLRVFETGKLKHLTTRLQKRPSFRRPVAKLQSTSVNIISKYTIHMTFTKKCPICLGTEKKVKNHYGGLSCGSCQAFFRRMTRENRIWKYQCLNSLGCYFSQGWRSCKKCRYRKCTENGMDPDLVSAQPGRQRKFSALCQALQNVDQIEKCVK